MSITAAYFKHYTRLFPEEFHAALDGKLAFKEELEKAKRLQIPSRIWLAYLTPPKPEMEGYIPKKLKVWPLKKAMLETLKHPKQFLDTRDPLHHSNECVTLALLETLYDLCEKKVLLPEERYYEWIEVAENFGLWRLRYLLEDTAFKTFDPENFSLFESVVEKQMFMDAHLVQAIHDIVGNALRSAGMKDFEIANRRKNIYGVYKKVALKGKSVNDIYDIHGFRIIVPKEKDCYRVAEVLHKLWPVFPERYKNYIQHPRENGYKSIHTTLRCLEGKPIEFQIRSREMDIVAASGPANHAEYKNGLKKFTLSELSHSSSH